MGMGTVFPMWSGFTLNFLLDLDEFDACGWLGDPLHSASPLNSRSAASLVSSS